MKTIPLFYISIILVLYGCSSQSTLFAHTYDGPPAHQNYDVNLIANATPTPHKGPYKHANYRVRGKTYYPLKSSKGYQAQGIASWYGRKFHGRLTANGERYSMYGMTAAHRTLPLPTYLRVTNLANQRSVIVRVNDRGPFHGDRLLDLSWAAAKKLGFAHIGTARVKIVAIDPNAPMKTAAPKTRSMTHSVVQVASFRTQHEAEALKASLQEKFPYTIFVTHDRHFFKVRMGPLRQSEQWQQVKAQLQMMQLNDVFLL